jgi:ATPase components of various ABC-type transport systems, contain duplicated ATPase
MVGSILDVEGLSVTYRSSRGTVQAVGCVSFQIRPGESVGIIGESGSGKSSVAYSVVGWTPQAQVTGRIKLDGFEIVGAREPDLRSLRGSVVSLVPQDPKKSLNPSMRVGPQVVEQLLAHDRSLSMREAKERVLVLFEQVNLPRPASLFNCYPHEISGGQQQRVLIAAAVSCEPKLIIMDEPTTGLDVTTSVLILELIEDLRQRSGCALLFISHDLSVVARVAERVLVMRNGTIVESGPTVQVFSQPSHDYTRHLISAVPKSVDDRETTTTSGTPTLSVSGVVKRFGGSFLRRDKRFTAVDQIDFSLSRGETLSVVGESGSGKTTLARIVAGLISSDEGSITLGAAPLATVPARRSRAQRQAVQLIFQNPDASLNPRHTIGDILKRPMHLYGICPREAMDARVAELLRGVQLPADYASRLPSQLSGGEKQRVAIARAFAARPQVVVCDEPTSALDLSVQAAVLELLLRLQREENVSYLFITHDLNVVRALGGRLIVMKNGRCLEAGPVAEIFARPRHDYTRELLSAAPALDEIVALLKTRVGPDALAASR